jgi:hypothetical protein
LATAVEEELGEVVGIVADESKSNGLVVFNNASKSSE